MNNFEIFPWNRSFAVGINNIDEQHKTLVDLVNKLALSFIEGTEYQSKDIFNELISYSQYHFESEEKILEKYAIPEEVLSLHKEGHSSFLPDILKIKEKYENSISNESLEETILFLIRWLAFHIIDEDKRLFFIIKSLKNKENFSNVSKDFIKLNSSKYDQESIKTIYFIWERTLRMKAIKDLKIINIKLKNLINNFI